MLLTACSISSIDSETKALIDACREIEDEAVRAQCLVGIKMSADER